MDSDWTADVVARMHHAGITGLMLAEECGIANSYLSAVLHQKKGKSDKTKDRILEGLDRLEKKMVEARS